MTAITTIILHSYAESDQSPEQYEETVGSIVAQTNRNFEVVFLDGVDPVSRDNMMKNSISTKEITSKEKSLGAKMNEVIRNSNAENVLYLDNQISPVILKKAALEAFLISAVRNPDSGFFYSDYELQDNGTVKEKKLLHHHIGRVRDNQDYGKASFIQKKAIEKISYFDESLKYNAMYDLRLKISEHYELTRISNKYSGSLYRVLAAGEKTNVFDYLLAGKEVQLEAEVVVTNHLKRMGAYLKPGQFIPVKSWYKDVSTLKASVIIPVGFRPEFIGTAIDSIQTQTVQDIEAIIVVNGGEKDPTAIVVKKYLKGGELYDPEKPEIRLMVIDINNIGLCLNLGVGIAKGKYYIQLDSDDRLKPDAVESIINCFKSSTDVGMVIGSYEVWEKKADDILSRMEDIPVVTHDEWTENNGRNNLLRINGAGAPRAIPIHVIKEMGYFSVNDDIFSRNYGEDYEMVSKIAESYEIGRIYEPIYEVIRHAGGTDHAINQDVIDRNDEAKDDMRRQIIIRRIGYNA